MTDRRSMPRCRLDAAIYLEGKPVNDGPVNRQLEELKAAAKQGAFDPLRIWGRVR